MTFLPNVGAHDIDPGSHLRYLPPPPTSPSSLQLRPYVGIQALAS